MLGGSKIISQLSRANFGKLPVTSKNVNGKSSLPMFNPQNSTLRMRDTSGLE
jgi:hypothetical protein